MLVIVLTILVILLLIIVPAGAVALWMRQTRVLEVVQAHGDSQIGQNAGVNLRLDAIDESDDRGKVKLHEEILACYRDHAEITKRLGQLAGQLAGRLPGKPPTE